MGLHELLCWMLYNDTYRYLLGHGTYLQRDRSTSMYVHVRDQTDNATYALTGWVPAVREDKDALPCMRRYSWSVQLSASPPKVLFRWLSFVDHIDHAAPREPRRWTTMRPR